MQQTKIIKKEQVKIKKYHNSIFSSHYKLESSAFKNTEIIIFVIETIM